MIRIEALVTPSAVGLKVTARLQLPLGRSGVPAQEPEVANPAGTATVRTMLLTTSGAAPVLVMATVCVPALVKSRVPGIRVN
jgi:hypothetical protein